MKAFLRFFAQVAFWTVAIGLMIYATSRSLNFIESTLNSEDQILGIFALLATSGGMLAWLLVFLYKADGIIQRGIALLMVLIDFLGEATLFTFDTLQQAGLNGVITQLSKSEIRTVLFGMSALIALNIFATITFHLSNMEVIRQIAEGAQKDLLFFKSMSEIEKQSDTYARDMAPAIAAEWQKSFNDNYGSATKLGLTGAAPAPASKWQFPKFNMWKKKKGGEPAPGGQTGAGSAPAAHSFFPITSRLSTGIRSTNFNINEGEELEAAILPNGNCLLRKPGTVEPVAEIHRSDLSAIVTGNTNVSRETFLVFPAPLVLNPANGNGSHPTPAA